MTNGNEDGKEFVTEGAVKVANWGFYIFLILLLVGFAIAYVTR